MIADTYCVCKASSHWHNVWLGLHAISAAPRKRIMMHRYFKLSAINRTPRNSGVRVTVYNTWTFPAPKGHPVGAAEIHIRAEG